MERYKRIFSIAVLIILFFSSSGSSFDKSLPKKELNCIADNNYSNYVNFIFNITENLSNIIKQNPKGREWGTTGEYKAAKILLENMSRIGFQDNNIYLELVNDNISDNNKIFKNLSLKSIDDKYDVHDWKFVAHFNNTSRPIECYITPKADLYYPRNYTYYSKNLKVLSFSDNIIKSLFKNSGNSDFLYIANRKIFEKINEKFNLNKFYLDNNSKYIIMYLIKFIKPKCKGIILYDDNNEVNNATHLMVANFGDWNYFSNQSKKSPATFPIPVISICGADGRWIEKNSDKIYIEFSLNQTFNKNVKSYNVIGNFTGKNNNETIIICAHYDSFWGPCSADNAIGCGIVMGIAKYFNENFIKNKTRCKIEFIFFTGEEYFFRGSVFHCLKHINENITCVICFDMCEFEQKNPPAHLEVWIPSQIKPEIKSIVEKTKYEERTGYNVTYKTQKFGPSDTDPFCYSHSSKGCKTILIGKDENFSGHHRVGYNYTTGDNMNLIDKKHLEVMFELALNITKEFTLNH